MNFDDKLLITFLLSVIILVTVLYAFPPDSLIEAIKQSGI